jgi:hypothetical protein
MRLVVVRFGSWLVATLCLLLLLPSTTFAEVKSKGLYISPIRNYLSVDAGKTASGTLTIANLTTAPMSIDLSVKQFSVTDFSYDYTFTQPVGNWVVLGSNRLDLQPNASKQVSYHVSVPKNTAPGGHYFALVAGTQPTSRGLPTTLQASEVLYITVTGNLIRTNELRDASIQQFILGNSIPYSFTIKNTGNVHYFAYASGGLSGVWYHTNLTGTSHLLLPGTSRTIAGTIPSPFLPGVYKATYGYQVDESATPIMKTAYIVFLPPWSILIIILLILFAKWLYKKRRTIHF